MKILITGGHLAPALALIKELLKYYPKEKIIFVGRKYINNFDKIYSLEFQEITKTGIKFFPIKTGRFSRYLSLRTILDFFFIPIGFFYALTIIFKTRPKLVISFGSYVSLPIVVVSWFFRIPILLHEQTIKPGLANRFSSFFSKKIYLAFPQSLVYFPKKKTEIIGNLLRREVLGVRKKIINLDKKNPVILVLGGSLGSHVINSHIHAIIGKLNKKFIVIHQTGESRIYNDYEKAVNLRLNNYFPKKFIYAEELGYVYKKADLVICRAGANTFFELLYHKKPAILIPLPWSAGNEQIYHAQIFKKLGCGEIFDQDRDSEELLDLIEYVYKNRDYYKKNFKNLPEAFRKIIKKNATKYLLTEIRSLLQ